MILVNRIPRIHGPAEIVVGRLGTNTGHHGEIAAESFGYRQPAVPARDIELAAAVDIGIELVIETEGGFHAATCLHRCGHFFLGGLRGVIGDDRTGKQ